MATFGVPRRLRRERFCREYIANGGNATRAAIAAGYSARTARSQGCELLTFPDVARRIGALIQRQWDQLGMTEVELVARVAAIARFDPCKLLDNCGSLLPLSDIDDQTRAALAEVEMTVFDAGAGKPKAMATRYRAADKIGALRLLVQQMRKVGAPIRSKAGSSIADRLAAARRRIREQDTRGEAESTATPQYSDSTT